MTTLTTTFPGGTICQEFKKASVIEVAERVCGDRKFYESALKMEIER